MKFLLPSLTFISIFFLTNTSAVLVNPETGECCGKCTGSAYCTACINCSRCSHCSGGGTCGVCGGGSSRSSIRSSERAVSSENVYSRFAPPISADPPKVNISTAKKSKPGEFLSTTSLAEVSSEMVNVRKGPGTEFEIVGRLYKNDQVEILENTSEKWLLIQAKMPDNHTSAIKGYVYASFLKR